MKEMRRRQTKIKEGLGRTIMEYDEAMQVANERAQRFE